MLINSFENQVTCAKEIVKGENFKNIDKSD